MDVQWYPGHMAKARRNMEEQRKLIDVVCELLDARVPLSSRNPDIDAMSAGKGRIVLLNKSDLADPLATALWKEYFVSKGILCSDVDARSAGSRKTVKDLISEAGKPKMERDARRGIRNRPVRVMICGIPNCGKSTLINSLAGRASARTGNRPGVTKANQWIKLGAGAELLDTPGLLWPRFESKETGLHLALLGSINDAILEPEELACELISVLSEKYSSAVKDRYGILCYDTPYECLAQIAGSRHCLKKGGEPDTERAARLLMDDFRSGKLGRITLERPDE